MVNTKEFAASSNGDRWFLESDDATNSLVVLHRANISSGGHETRTAIETFLNIRPFGPEREALLAILGPDHGNQVESKAW